MREVARLAGVGWHYGSMPSDAVYFEGSPSRRRGSRQLFLGSLALTGPGVMQPEFSSLYDAASELLAAWDASKLPADEFARRLSLLRVVDDTGVEWTVGASSLSWYQRLGEGDWFPCAPPDVSVAASRSAPDVLSDLASIPRPLDAPPTGAADTVIVDPVAGVSVPLTPESPSSLPVGVVPPLAQDSDPLADLSSVSVGVWENQGAFLGSDVAPDAGSVPPADPQTADGVAGAPVGVSGPGGLVSSADGAGSSVAGAASVAFSWQHNPSGPFADIEGVADDDLLRQLLGED